MLKLNLYIGEYMLVGIIFCYWIYSANNWGNICQWNLYIGIGYILPTIVKYIFVKIIFWYWIYSANNWGIYVS